MTALFMLLKPCEATMSDLAKTWIFEASYSRGAELGRGILFGHITRAKVFSFYISGCNISNQLDILTRFIIDSFHVS